VRHFQHFCQIRPCRDFTIPAEKVNFSPAANALPGGRWNIQTWDFRIETPAMDSQSMMLWRGFTGAAKAFKQGHPGLRQTRIVGAAKHYFKV
jgi:hypothetical protein